MTPEPALGLYVHVPFCSAICNYCNFNRGLYDETLKARYVEALRREIRMPDLKVRPTRDTDTIFFGGGTPSLLEPGEIASIIQAVRDAFDLASDAEITLETNPETGDRQQRERF